MHGPPNPEKRSPAIRQDDRAKSQPALSNIETAIAALDLQASRLRRVYLFCPETARLIAAHAYRVQP